MKNLHIIMPMAGEGKRFRDIGYNVPKPLIKVDNKELYRRAVESITNDIDKDIVIKFTFIVRAEYVEDYNIDEQIRKYYPTANIVSVYKTTRGALETALLAEPYIDIDKDNIMIMDCDIEFHCVQYMNELNVNKYSLSYENNAPMLLSFYSHDPRYSYAECIGDYSFWAIRTAEKNTISTHALAGCYYFGDAKIFLKLSKQLIDDFGKGELDAKECYVSLLYNYYFKYSYNMIKLVDLNQHTDKYISYGTPEELLFAINNKYNNIWDRK